MQIPSTEIDISNNNNKQNNPINNLSETLPPALPCYPINVDAAIVTLFLTSMIMDKKMDQ